MKSINIAFSKGTHRLFEKIIGKCFVKFSSNKYDYSNSVYGIVGIYIDDEIYKITNYIDVVDYYGKKEDVAVFKFEEADNSEIVSPIQNEEMNDTLIKKIIKKIEVVNENQIQYKNGEILYNNWVTRGVIFYFDDGTELSFEKDIWFSEDIGIERGKNLIDKFSSTDEFSEAWEPEDENEIIEYSGKATRENITFM